MMVVLKAFGDLTIAATALERMRGDAAPELLIGSHLLPLARALDIQLPWTTLQIPESGVPAMYDVRRCGAFAAARSFLQVRRALRGTLSNQAPVFDKSGLRERALAFPRRVSGLPAASNIYLSYRLFSGEQDTAPLSPIPASGRIGIFPGSRVAAKNLPVSLVDDVVSACVAAGWKPILYLLDGERPDLQTPDRDHVVVPRRFESMIAAVAGCDAVIAADSLPAHLAERAARPVFVLSPVENRFWLPFSAYSANRWSLFQEGVAAKAFIRFIEPSE